MGRKILACIVAIIISSAIIWIGWMISTSLAPNTPNNLGSSSNQDLANYTDSLPRVSYVAALIGYFLAAFAGGFIVTKMSRQVSQGITMPVVVGAILTAGMVVNIIMLPGQPLWFIVIALMMFLPLSLFGHRLAR